MRTILFLSDIQDLWILHPFLKPRIEIIWAPTNKITSPHKYLDQLKDYHLHEFRGVEDKKFLNLLNACDYFITKECKPFLGNNPFAEKTYSIGWCGESCTYNTRNSINIENSYKYHFCEQHYLRLYFKMGFDKNSIMPHSPKYYFLNGQTRESICGMLGLDPEKKYATNFSGNIGSATPNTLQFINEYFKRNNIEILTKSKMKHGAGTKFRGDNFKNGNCFHEGILLQSISVCSFGLPTSSCVESEVLGTRFISFWAHPRMKDDELYDDIIKNGKGYRMAQSSSTFRIYPEEKFEETIPKLEEWLERTKEQKYNFDNKFDIHSLLRKFV